MEAKSANPAVDISSEKFQQLMVRNMYYLMMKIDVMDVMLKELYMKITEVDENIFQKIYDEMYENLKTRMQADLVT